MDCFLMQDWLTARGASTLTSVTQTESTWLDVGPYQDIVVWLQVQDWTTPVSAGGSLFLDVQTSPSRDDMYFLTMVGGSGITLVTQSLPTVKKLTKEVAAVPVSRWLRWKLNVGAQTPNQAWAATFRIWIAANYRASHSSAGDAPKLITSADAPVIAGR
jgi:hypothetical protein